MIPQVYPVLPAELHLLVVIFRQQAVLEDSLLLVQDLQKVALEATPEALVEWEQVIAVWGNIPLPVVVAVVAGELSA